MLRVEKEGEPVIRIEEKSFSLSHAGEVCCLLDIQKKLHEKNPDLAEIRNVTELAGTRICFSVFKIRAAQSESDFEILS